MDGQLNELEPHPAAKGARQWLIGYIQRNDAYALLRLQESFASCAIEGNRLTEICSETLRRVLNKEPVSDRYLLGLVWTIRDMEEKEKQEAGADLTKELAGALKVIKQTFEDLSGAATDLRERVFLDGVLAVIEVNGNAALDKAKAAGLV